MTKLSCLLLFAFLACCLSLKASPKLDDKQKIKRLYADPSDATPIDGVVPLVTEGDENISNSATTQLQANGQELGDERSTRKDKLPATNGDKKSPKKNEPPATEGDEKISREDGPPTTEEDENSPREDKLPAINGDEKSPKKNEPPATEGDEKIPREDGPPTTEEDEKSPREDKLPATKGDEKSPKKNEPPATEKDEKISKQADWTTATENDENSAKASDITIFVSPQLDDKQKIEKLFIDRYADPGGGVLAMGDESIPDSAKSMQLQVNGQELAPELKYDSEEIPADDDEINDPSVVTFLKIYRG